MTSKEWLLQFCAGLLIGVVLLLVLGTCSMGDTYEQIPSPQPIEMRD